MRDTRMYLVPDYYPYFQCKIGACRHACCNGWPVTISMKDYYSLVGINCSPDLRRRLDTALHIVSHPAEDEYAEISPRYDGRCPLQIEDGRCGLQAEIGEDALALVCRLYPRGVRYGEHFECSCANSCEAVSELLLNHTEPLRFISVPLSFDLPVFKRPENIFPTAGKGQEIRLYYIRIVQNRSQIIPDRLMSLGIAMQNMEKALRANDEIQINYLLSHEPACFDGTKEDPTQQQLDAGLKIAGSMLRQVDERSQSVRIFGEEALKWFSLGGNSIDKYKLAIENFETILPDWEIVFEHLMVNHMFFEQFPFQDRPVPVADEFLAVCAVYTLLRFLSVGWLAIHPSQADFVDVCSALFRLIQHTAFDSFAANLLKQLGCTGPDQVYDLIRL